MENITSIKLMFADGTTQFNSSLHKLQRDIECLKREYYNFTGLYYDSCLEKSIDDETLGKFKEAFIKLLEECKKEEK